MTPKLVRDLVPTRAAEHGDEMRTRAAGPGELPGLLRAKLREEVDEYLVMDDPAELADVLEVVYALALGHGLSPAALERLRLAKRADRGGFTARLVWAGGDGG